jgi:hypothetical protein
MSSASCLLMTDDYTDAESQWLDNPDWAQVPAGMEGRVVGESGFAWESLAFGGKFAYYNSESLHLPTGAKVTGQPPELSPGVPHFV